jgi:hypothetical protein
MKKVTGYFVQREKSNNCLVIGFIVLAMALVIQCIVTFGYAHNAHDSFGQYLYLIVGVLVSAPYFLLSLSYSQERIRLDFLFDGENFVIEKYVNCKLSQKMEIEKWRFSVNVIPGSGKTVTRMLSSLEVVTCKMRNLTIAEEIKESENPGFPIYVNYGMTEDYFSLDKGIIQNVSLLLEK